MAIVIGVAWYGVRAVGGMPQLLAKLAERRAAVGPGASDITALLPDFSRGISGEALWTLPVITFVVHLAVQWWAFWYPGAEPGGGGYIAQRIFSAKDERNGLLSVLWFNLAHYALRPWPWILTALVAVILYPNLAQPERGFMLVATRQTPHALLGILLAGFMAAFMSTVATQLNWGSSYLIEDFYRRFLKKEGSEAHFVNASRLATALLVVAAAAVAWELKSVSDGWKIVLELGAGTGGVYPSWPATFRSRATWGATFSVGFSAACSFIPRFSASASFVLASTRKGCFLRFWPSPALWRSLA